MGCVPSERDRPIDPDRAECTDVFCLLLFIIYWIGLIVIFFASIFTGDINALMYGADYMGHRCGIGKYEKKPNVYYPRMSADMYEQEKLLLQDPLSISLYGLCVESCPRQDAVVEDYGWETQGQSKLTRPEWEVPMPTISTLHRCIPYNVENRSQTILCAQPTCYDAGKPCFQTALDLVPKDTWKIESVFDFRECNRQLDLTVTTDARQANAGPILQTALQFAGMLQSAYDSLYAARAIIGTFGVAVPCLLMFLWCVFLFFFAGCAVYLALMLLGMALFGGAFYFGYKGNVFGEYLSRKIAEGVFFASDWVHEQAASQGYHGVKLDDQVLAGVLERQHDYWETAYQWLGSILGIVFVLYMIFVCLAGSKIKRTSALVKEATSVVRNSVMLVVLPVFIGVLQLILLVFTILTLAFMLTNPAQTYMNQKLYAQNLIESFGNATDFDGLGRVWGSVFDFELSDQEVTIYQSIYVLFGFLWTYQFFIAIEIATISGCVVYYYFIDMDTAGYKDDRYADNQTDFVVTTMLAHVLRCNLGTMALGSFVLACIELLRIFMEYLDEQAKVGKDGDAGVLTCIFKCCKYYLICFEKCVKYLTQYAYTFVIMENRGFCSACFASYNLVAEHPLQLGLNKVVQVILFWIQTATIPIISTVLAYQVMVRESEERRGQYDIDFVGPVTPSVAVFFLSLIFARSFAVVYEQCITSLTVCVLQDLQEYDPPFISKELHAAFELGDYDELGFSKGANVKDPKKDKSKPYPLQNRKMFKGGRFGHSRLDDDDLDFMARGGRI